MCLSYQVAAKLGLSYHNKAGIDEVLDAIPERAGTWMTKQLRFSDMPNYTYTLRYRDPIQAVRSLLEDPALKKYMRFKPTKVYNHEASAGKERIYSEMWTGRWWWNAQVSFYFSVC